MSADFRLFDTAKDVFPYLAFVMLIKLVIFCFETYLELRQYSKFKETEVPADIKSFVKAQTFEESQSYNYEKKHFCIVKSVYDFIFQTISLYFQLTAIIWEIDFVLLKLGLNPDSEINRTYFTSFWLYIISTILDMPWNYYETFVIEQKHGLNTMNLYTFITDKIKGSILACIFVLILAPIVIKIIEYGGDRFYIFMFIFSVILLFALMWLIPNFIQPLFNKYEEFEDSDLKTKIYSLSAKLEFPLKKLFKVDESMRSNNSNAYFFGFGSNKRIVIYDNLIKHLETDEIVAVVGHELGHWKLNHNIVTIGMALSNIFLTFLIFSYTIHWDDILISFGFKKHYNIVALLVFLEIFTPLDYISNLATIFITRKLEFQADKFAKDLGYKELLMKGLIRLYTKNKGNLNPDPLYAAYHFSHPELIERLRALGDFQNILTFEELEQTEKELKAKEQQRLLEKEASNKETPDQSQFNTEHEDPNFTTNKQKIE